MNSTAKPILLFLFLSSIFLHCSAQSETEEAETSHHSSAKKEALGADDWGPVLSPDGKHILFYSTRNGKSLGRIFKMNADGTELHEIDYPQTGGHDIEPNWSPDGKKIAFTSQRNFGENGEVSSSIYLMNVDGSDFQELYDYDGKGDGATHFGDWNEKGNGFIFFYWAYQGFKPNVYYVNLNGEGLKQLTDDHSSYRPQYSNGHVFFMSNRSGKPKQYAVGIDGKEEVDLVEATGYDLAFGSAAEDGFYFCTSEAEKGSSTLYKMDYHSQKVSKCLSFNHIPAFFFSISTHYNQFLFNQAGPNNIDIYQLDLKTGKAKALVADK